MNLALACALAVLMCNGAASSSDIRRVDFASLDYPFADPDDWPDKIHWQNLSEPKRIRLVKGRWKEPYEDADRSELPFSGMTLEEVTYGDLAGDDDDEAIVVLRFDTGGTQYHYWVYIFGIERDRPKLLAYFRTGDRAAQGLYRVYAQHYTLVVEVFDPEKQRGDCCSAGYLRYTHRWAGTTFARTGALQHGIPVSLSRRRVTTFGTPSDQMHPQR